MPEVKIPLPAALLTTAIVFAMSAYFFLVEDEEEVSERVEQEVYTDNVYAKNAQFKLVYIVPEDAQLSKVALYQAVSDATLQAIDSSNQAAVHLWRRRGQMKVALKVADNKEMSRRIALIKDSGLNAGIVGEIGFVGVDEVGRIDEFCGDLRLL